MRVVIGAGAIGVEFAWFFNAFGTKVTIVEMLDHLLPIEDTDVSKALEKSFKKQGIAYLLGQKTTGAVTGSDGVEITVEAAAGGEKQGAIEGVRFYLLPPTTSTATAAIGASAAGRDFRKGVLKERNVRQRQTHSSGP